jgi:hypothetical protein
MGIDQRSRFDHESQMEQVDVPRPFPRDDMPYHQDQAVAALSQRSRRSSRCDATVTASAWMSITRHLKPAIPVRTTAPSEWREPLDLERAAAVSANYASWHSFVPGTSAPPSSRHLGDWRLCRTGCQRAILRRTQSVLFSLSFFCWGPLFDPLHSSLPSSFPFPFLTLTRRAQGSLSTTTTQ